MIALLELKKITNRKYKKLQLERAILVYLDHSRSVVANERLNIICLCHLLPNHMEEESVTISIKPISHSFFPSPLKIANPRQ